MTSAAPQPPVERAAPNEGPALDPLLSEVEFRRLAGVSRRLPLSWTATVRRRRLLLLALCAPGFLAIFSTPIHRTLLVLVVGAITFAAALVFRSRTECVFVRAEATALWPPAPPAPPPTPESSHA